MLRLDDIASNMHWDHFHRLQARVDQLGIRPLIGIIPDNRDPELLAFPAAANDFWGEMRGLQARGWDIALHGHQHRYASPDGGLLAVNAYGEFAGLSYRVQREKLERALGVFASQGIRTDTFMAPGHAYDHTTLRALSDVGIRCVTDGYALFPFECHRLVFVPQILARPRPMPFGIFTTCIHLNQMDETDLARLESFLGRYHERFITFSEARRYVTDSRWNRAMGEAGRRGLHAIRRVRGRLRQARA